ncbi:hypothetical protein HPB50_006731 [Hyalomma asiaticum]|uniref:Uncharacterized protein n=1 Tax=Hyalomma asiaticum TaxID=266040 RepID=A0ACB7TDK4_HYAAI|nr:hypothetical protein HPB50_006731 [Hyalomma asiaticum]
MIVVLKLRVTLDLKATIGLGQAGSSVRSIHGADTSAGLAVWPIWDQHVLVCTLKSVDTAKLLLRNITLQVGDRRLPFRGHPKLSSEFSRGVVHVSQDDTPGTLAVEQVLARDRSLTASQVAGSTYVLLLLTAQQNTTALRAAASVAVASRLEIPVVLDGSRSRSNVKSGAPSKPPVLVVKDFPTMTPAQTVLHTKKVGSSEPLQRAEYGDDGSSITSCLTSVSLQDADLKASFGLGQAGSAVRSILGADASVGLATVRESFQGMFTAAFTQAPLGILTQVSDSLHKAMQAWVSSRLDNITQCDPPQLKRKPASCQAVKEVFSGPAPDGPVHFLQWPRRLQGRAGLLHSKYTLKDG